VINFFAGLVLSTVLIVIFAEIIPQAFCSRHGLLFGAKTIWIIRMCMAILSPVAFPLAFILDKACSPLLFPLLPLEMHCSCFGTAKQWLSGRECGRLLSSLVIPAWADGQAACAYLTFLLYQESLCARGQGLPVILA
jgi:hypothetical protein